VLRTYQKNIWVILNHTESFITIKLRKKILNMFKIKRDAKARKIIFILFFIFMFGIDKLRINKR